MSEHPPMPFQDGALAAISREELADLPIGRYDGEVLIVCDADGRARAREDFAQETLVGLDTETRPAFRKGEHYPPSLVQVATGRAVYLFQLACAETHPLLRALLEEPRVLKAGVGLAHDLRSLQTVFGFEPRNVVDVGALARRRGCTQTGVRNLAGMFLDVRIPKGARTSNWSARTLTRQQITYAATDAWVCRELFLRFETLGLADA